MRGADPGDGSAGVGAATGVGIDPTFPDPEAEGTLWMYHVRLMGADGGGLDESRRLDALPSYDPLGTRDLTTDRPPSLPGHGRIHL